MPPQRRSTAEEHAGLWLCPRPLAVPRGCQGDTRGGLAVPQGTGLGLSSACAAVELRGDNGL